MGDLYIGKMMITLSVAILATCIHLFAFFSFKAKIHTYDKKSLILDVKIHEQEKIKEVLQFQIYSNDNYSKVKDYIAKSNNFEKISLSDVSFYGKSVQNLSKRISV